MPIEDGPVSTDSTRRMDLLDPMLGDGKGWGVVTVHAGMLVERSSIVLASHGVHF